MKIFTQSVLILCRKTVKEIVQLLPNILFMLKIVWLLLETLQRFLMDVRLLLKDINERLLLKENVQLLPNIFFYVEDCVAAFKNISVFFNKRAAAPEKIFNDCF